MASQVETAAQQAVAWQPRVGKSLATEIAAEQNAGRYTAACEQARLFLASGRPAEALNVCTGAAAIVTEGWEVHLLMGEAQTASGAVVEARSEFELVLRLEPGCAPAARGLAGAVATLEGNEAAVPYWRRAADLLEYWGKDSSPNNGASGPLKQQLSRAGLAHRFLRGGLWEHAVQEARACLDIEPGRIDLVIVLIRALWRSHQLDEARVALAALRSRQPLALPANLLAALDAEVNGGDSSQPLAMARRVDPLLRGAFRVLDTSELTLLAPDLEAHGQVELPAAPTRPIPGTIPQAPQPAAEPQPSAPEPVTGEPEAPAMPPESSTDDGDASETASSTAAPDTAEEPSSPVVEQDQPAGSDGEVTIAPSAPEPSDSDDVGSLTTLDLPRTAEGWRAVGDERRRQGDFAGAIKAYAEALALLRPE
ncbi:MAG: hypothetical protein CL878_10795 [Dehalococcoidia bacterium]|nr:hypothetical protein [Dehalococcoidia bacterium]